jgi:hypothetical protein
LNARYDTDTRWATGDAATRDALESGRGGGRGTSASEKEKKSAIINPPAPAPARLPHRASAHSPATSVSSSPPTPLERRARRRSADHGPPRPVHHLLRQGERQGSRHLPRCGSSTSSLARARADTLPAAFDPPERVGSDEGPGPAHLPIPPLAARRKPHPRVPLLPHPRVMVHEPGPRGARCAPRSRRAPPSPARATAPRLGIPDPRTTHSRRPRPVPRS